MKAICLGCGRSKWGAWVRCSGCGLHPTAGPPAARHLLISDAYLSADELSACAADVRAGVPLDFDEEEVAALAADLDATPAAPVWFALLVAGVPALALGLSLAFAAWLWAG